MLFLLTNVCSLHEQTAKKLNNKFQAECYNVQFLKKYQIKELIFRRAFATQYFRQASS